MSQKILTDIGENYEYLRTIVDNRIELIKLDIVAGTSRTAGFFVMGLVGLVVFGVILMGLTTALALWLAQPLGSLTSGILVSCGILLVLILLIYLMRKPLIIRPAARLMVKAFLEDDENANGQSPRK